MRQRPAIAFGFILVTGALLLATVPARAEIIPDYILNKDFETCLKQTQSAKDTTPAQQHNYCQCIRTQVQKTWTIEDYGRFVIGHITGGSGTSPEDAKMSQMAKQCTIEALRLK